MSQKKINYLSRDFNGIRTELEKFSYQYYPELADEYNDSIIGAWFMDLVAAVGDDLRITLTGIIRRLPLIMRILGALCLISQGTAV